MGRSIRWRITAIASVITLAVLAVVGILAVVVVTAELEQNLDRSLQQRADQIEALALAGDAGALANRNDEDRFAQILDLDGIVVAATPNVSGEPALGELPDGAQRVATRTDLPLEDDAYRVLVRRFDVDDGTQFVVVAENIDDLRDSVRAVTTTLLVLFPAAAVVLAMAVWWLVGRTLRPVESIRDEVTRIGLSELDHRVPVPGTGDEIDRLAATMNDMLGRLQSSEEQQRRFVADVSHELRTPLTRLRTALEVERRSADRDLERAVDDALGDVVEMQDLVDDLLFLARVDAGRAHRPPVPVDLDAIVADEVASLGDARPTVAATLAPVVVAGDPGQLARLVRNLVTNAARHAATAVAVRLSVDDGDAVVVVDDDGSGIAPDDRDRVFDRFVRLDDARRTGVGGTGLGLAIARDVVMLHGGTITIDDSPAGGARFVVRLPHASDE